ncbi:MAG TPA: hypothetical protein VKY92_20050, partial [Verrucomicrobiae bacterium]|nr:hypothetical protein [Verrucomicrobiae bacterium]
NQPIGVALENLAKAETSLKESSALLEADTIVAAEERERAALSALVATRKMFQQAVSEHPSDFAPQKDSPTDPLASDQRLNKMAEFRDEAKSAEEFVQRLLEQQREVEARAADDHHSNGSVAEAEQKLSHDLMDFTAQHPRPFKNARAQSEEAQRSLESAGAALDQKAVGSASAVRRATQGLETLNSAMAKQDQGRRMADSYRLKQMIEDQVRSLDALAKSDQPPTQEKAAETARIARQTLDEFKKNVEALGAENLGQPLRDATSDGSYSELNQKLDRLQSAGSDQERQRRAGEARDSLAQLGRAFDASEPGALQAARKSDSLQPYAERGFDKGVSQLENLLKQLQQGRNLSSADQEKQARDALENMQRGLEAKFGENERGQALLNGFQQLVEGHGMDPEGIRKILAQLEQFSNETRPKVAGAMAAYEILNPDLGQIPAAYRDRIERYFQKLSEK